MYSDHEMLGGSSDHGMRENIYSDHEMLLAEKEQ